MLDIFTPIIPEDKLHPNFKVLRAESNRYARNTISSWTEGFVDRDGKIIQEFQSTFNSSFWEFYLNASFNTLGFNIDYSYDRPDFLLDKGGRTYAVEATISNHPDGAAPEWEKGPIPKITADMWFQIINLSTIRLANAIFSKHKKFLNSYAKLDHVKNNPFILCVAPFEQPLFFEQADNAIRRVLYKFSAPLYIKDEDTGKVRVVGEEHIEKVVKHNDQIIDLGFFTNDKMKEISAIIFSNTATTTKAKALDSANHPTTLFHATRFQQGAWDTPYSIVGLGEEYHETLLDGLHIFLNPFAERPIDPDQFFSEEISLHTYDPVEELPLEFVNDGALLSHGCISFHSKETINDLKLQQKDLEFKDYSFEWEEDKLYPLTATVGTGMNNHLAHYCGWTIVVFQDSIDKDWGAFAKGEQVYTIQRFISLGDKKGMLSPHDFYDTKEAAFDEIKKLINEHVKLVSV
ncbi:hypothetical protein [Pseudodesulfovibrio indicus]|uniref:Uncharacterized protein n=1 Tax=Pseudodesulfovibrio indicus TaxID=1716143 RepID=A0A126QRV9_9BACT|nr:hypothetical protein [Pseudodesulfovibrio indicus]AMK12803.1 hypothetical protein AWY79_17670 [Pseudodesulfovibrio indicus]TDT86707.1 hypothetical protein EDC59_11125 [Pseudodesulfovibrio indicus]